jgi:hypothetical protein
MPDRLDRLERTVESIARSVSDLEARLAALEAEPSRAHHPSKGSPEPASPAAAPSPSPSATSWTAGLPRVGRTFLVLGGAFLLRAITEAGTWPAITGVSLGLAYALVWVGLAHREAAAQRRTSATFHALTSVLVAYPVLFESAIRFGVLSAAGAGIALAFVTALGLAVASRGRLLVGAWWFVLGSTATIVVLHLREGRPLFFGGLLVALGIATQALASARGWGGPRWLVAVAANLAVLRAASVPQPEPGTSLLLVLYLLSYLGTFAILTLVRRRSIGAFEVLQSAAVLLVGIGGAVHVARASGRGGGFVGVATLVVGALAYATAFALVRRRLGRGRTFFFYSTLGLVLVLTGSRLLGHVGFCTAIWGILAVTGAFLGGRFDRVTLRAHSAVYAVAASVRSGLISVTADTLVGSASHGFSDAPWALPALASVILAYGILVATRAFRKPPRLARMPRLALAAVALLGVTSLLVRLVVAAVPEAAAANESFLAAVRSGVVALAAIAFAFARKHARLRELGWLSVALLVAGALKLVLEDLPAGGASALFVAFALYGAALIFVPRLLRSPPRAAVPQSGGSD